MRLTTKPDFVYSSAVAKKSLTSDRIFEEFYNAKKGNIERRYKTSDERDQKMRELKDRHERRAQDQKYDRVKPPDPPTGIKIPLKPK